MRATTWMGGGLLGLTLAAWATSMVVGFDVVADVNPAQAGLLPGNEGLVLGSDHMGRDVFWRLITASEAFVGPGLLACVIAVGLGVPSGAVAGYLGGSWARAIRYLFDVAASLPRFILVLMACAIYGSTPTVLAVAAGAAYAPGLGQEVFGRLERLRNQEFVLAARAHGMSDGQILGYHLLWVNCRRLVTRHLLTLFGYILVLETTLSYIGGFGIEEPQPSWGNMLAFEFGVHQGNPVAYLAPAIAIWGTILGTRFLAEALQEAPDV